MTDKSNIAGPEDAFAPNKPEARLIYTCNCGWIDLGHANPTSANKLLDDVRAATGQPLGGVVTYSQTVRIWIVNLNAVMHDYLVAPGLSPADQQSVALAIFQDTSMAYEGLQETFGSSSGFSEEDLVSDLIGFHAAANEQKVDEDFVKRHCGKILSAKEAGDVWDQTGGVAKNKNRGWTPHLHTCVACSKACPGDRAFPSELGSIKPAQLGGGKVKRV